MLSIDINDKQLKLVKGSLAGNKIRINDVETRDIPEGSIVNGYINDTPPVANLITQILTEKKISEKEIIVCINSSSILYKELEVLKPKTLKNSAAIEAMIIAQMGIANDYNISYTIVGEGTADADGNATIKVMATACPQRMVDGYQLLFAQAGLKLKQINISNNCITRLIMNTPRLKDAMPFLCIQVDDEFVNINLYEDGQVALSRYIKIDPSDYEENADYVNIAVFDNLFRMIQFIGQRPEAKPLKQIMFYGTIRDFVALSNSILSFNIPAHVLAMPSNIQKYCKEDFDFAKYANAIGAFYKVDPINEHINLLESTAVKSKKAGDMFPLKALLALGISVGVVAGAYFIIDYINKGIEKDTKAISEKITEGQFGEKRAEMDLMLGVNANFNEYKHMVQLSQVMYDFLPWGTLPQLVQQLYFGVQQAEQNGSGQFLAFHDIETTEYIVTMKMYSADTVFPSDFIEALIDLGFFENITYSGFTTVEYGELEARVASRIPGGIGSVVECEISMQLKGGHIYEADGYKYSR